MTWKGSYLRAVLALGLVLTVPAGKPQQTNTPKREGQTSQSLGATTPKKQAAHPPSGSTVNPPANAATNQSVPMVTRSAGKVQHTPFSNAKQVNSSSPQFAHTESGKTATANGGASAGSSGFSDLTGVSQSKDTNVIEFRGGSDKPLQIVPKGQAASRSRVSTQVATLPANAVQGTAINPPKREKPAEPPRQP